jgi:hypothetical protein
MPEAGGHPYAVGRGTDSMHTCKSLICWATLPSSAWAGEGCALDIAYSSCGYIQRLA